MSCSIPDGGDLGRSAAAWMLFEALRTKLIPRASLITPNLPEAAALLDEPVAASERPPSRARASGCWRWVVRRC